MDQVIIGNDVQWTDVAMVILTALLFIGAVIAAIQVGRQIAQGERHHREQLLASLRPVIVLPNVESRVHQAIGLQVVAWVRNVGPGPAMQIEIRAWLRIPKISWDDPKARVQEIDQLKSEIDVDEPELFARAAALSSGNEDARLFLVPNVTIAPLNYPAEQAILVYIILFQDTFDNTYPSKPRGEWKLGHVQVSPEGNWKLPT